MEEVNFESDIEIYDQEFDYKPNENDIQKIKRGKKQKNRDKYIKSVIQRNVNSIIPKTLCKKFTSNLKSTISKTNLNSIAMNAINIPSI